MVPVDSCAHVCCVLDDKLSNDSVTPYGPPLKDQGSEQLLSTEHDRDVGHIDYMDTVYYAAVSGYSQSADSLQRATSCT